MKASRRNFIRSGLLFIATPNLFIPKLIERPRWKPGSVITRAEFDWYSYRFGILITWTELKKDGITVIDK